MKSSINKLRRRRIKEHMISKDEKQLKCSESMFMLLPVSIRVKISTFLDPISFQESITVSKQWYKEYNEHSGIEHTIIPEFELRPKKNCVQTDDEDGCSISIENKDGGSIVINYKVHRVNMESQLSTFWKIYVII